MTEQHYISPQEVSFERRSQEDLPEDKYQPIIDMNPGFMYTLRALPQVAEEYNLTAQEQENLLLLRMWVDDPDQLERAAPVFQMSGTGIQRRVHSSIDRLEEPFINLQHVENEIKKERRKTPTTPEERLQKRIARFLKNGSKHLTLLS